MKLKERVKMIKFKIEELKVVSIEELSENMFIEECDFEIDGKVESGVYKIDVGSRGEIEDISKVEVVDGVFEVKSREELLDSCEDEEEREEMEYWCYVEMFEGVVSVCEFEEYGYDYVKLVVD